MTTPVRSARSPGQVQRKLATACYGRVSFFEAASGKLSQKLEWQGSLVSMVLSPDGDIVACGSQDNTVHFWRKDRQLWKIFNEKQAFGLDQNPLYQDAFDTNENPLYDADADTGETFF